MLPFTAWAAEELAPISPDRAGASVSADTVGAGLTQLELGWQYSRESVAASPADRHFSIQAGVRFGLTRDFEVGMSGEPVVSLTGADSATNVGVLQLSAKYVFYESAPSSILPTLGVQPFVKLPVAQPPIDSGKTDGGLLFLVSFDLPYAFSLDLNAGMAGISQGSHGPLAQAQAAAGVGCDLSLAFNLFSDLFFISREERHGRSSLTFDAGVLWRLSSNVAVDASVVTSLVGQGPDWGVSAGVSVRWGR